MNTTHQNNSNAEPFEDWHLTAYALGELDPVQAELVRAHIDRNPHLRAELLEIQQAVGAVQASLANQIASSGLRSEQKDAIAKQVVAPELQRNKHVALQKKLSWEKRRQIIEWMSVAAAIPLVVGSFVWFYQGGGRKDEIGYKDNSPSAYANKDVRQDDLALSNQPSVAKGPGSSGALENTESVGRDGQNAIEESGKQLEAAASAPMVAKLEANTSQPKAIQDAQLANSDGDESKDMTTLSTVVTAPTPASSVAPKSNSRAESSPSFKGGRVAASAAGAPAGPPSGYAGPPSGYGGGALGGASGAPSAGLGGGGMGGGGYAEARGGAAYGGGAYGGGGRPSLGGAAAPPMGGSSGYPGDSKNGIDRLATDFEEEVTTGGQGTGPEKESNGKQISDESMRRYSAGVEPPFGNPDLKAIEKRRPIPRELQANVPHLFAEQPPAGDRFDSLQESPFVKVAQEPLSTFSIDVDTASYSKLRQYIIENRSLPNPESVRIEELVNYFDYEYPGPKGDDPFAAHMRVGVCPWNNEHKLVRVALQAKKVDVENRPSANIVFLIDVSGSMSAENKLPLVKKSLAMMTKQLRNDDRVAIVVYAGAAGCVLPSTLGSQKEAILASIEHLQSGGSTNGSQGIQLAYEIAKENFIKDGINRVVLCTDGDFNVGVTGTDQLVEMMKENASSNVFLTCLGYGIGNYNDSMMEQISDKGNGTYGMVDNEREAKRMMVEQLSGTLMTVAKDVKIQIEFNPQRVAAYRLVGYENRRLANKDFDNDKKDAGEIGAGHRVTAFYEIVPVGAAIEPQSKSELRYQPVTKEAAAPSVGGDESLAKEWLTLKVRSKKPEANESTKQTFILTTDEVELNAIDEREYAWATSVAEFGLLLRHSKMAPNADWSRMLERAAESAGSDSYRRECLEMMRIARGLSGN